MSKSIEETVQAFRNHFPFLHFRIGNSTSGLKCILVYDSNPEKTTKLHFYAIWPDRGDKSISTGQMEKFLKQVKTPDDFLRKWLINKRQFPF